MSGKGTYFVTPVGRLVAGDPWRAGDRDVNGNPLTIKSGPNIGQPRVEYYVALAIRKDDPGLPELFGKIIQAAHEGFPDLVDAQGNVVGGKFAWKFVDGDSAVPNMKGTVPNTQIGRPGHFTHRPQRQG